MGQLSDRQKAVLVGNILGDGYLHLNPYGTASLEVKQKETRKDYIYWLWNEFRNLCSVEPSQRQDNYQWRLRTRYLPQLAHFHSIFYGRNGKRVPVRIAELLKEPISLAVWYMDDGTLDWRLHSHYSFRLTTHCFPFAQQFLLAHALNRNFSIEAAVQKTTMRGKVRHILYIGKNGRDKFLQLIEPFVLKVFRYKLPPIL